MTKIIRGRIKDDYEPLTEEEIEEIIQKAVRKGHFKKTKDSEDKHDTANNTTTTLGRR